MSAEAKYQAAANDLMFGGVLDLAKHGLEYRKGKCGEHVKHALGKALKNGCGSTQFELSMLECYLGNVLKVPRK